jgi:hypothetical protein
MTLPYRICSIGFNKALKKVAQKIGHGAPTLRKHYLLPIIEETFYKKGVVSRIKI